MTDQSEPGGWERLRMTKDDDHDHAGNQVKQEVDGPRPHPCPSLPEVFDLLDRAHPSQDY